MTREELLNVSAGGISAAMLNAIVRLGSILLEIGRALGSSISRTRNNNTCEEA